MQATHLSHETEAFNCTRHAVVRGQQRGIRKSDRQLVFQFGDREERARGGVFRLSISTRQMKFLLKHKLVSPSQAERCSRLTLVTDGSTILTNYRAPRAH